jgi:hypothetical protein
VSFYDKWCSDSFGNPSLCPSLGETEVPFYVQSIISGGSGNYTYSWSGDCISNAKNCGNSDGFKTAGNKVVNIMVKSSDGQTATNSCLFNFSNRVYRTQYPQ